MPEDERFCFIMEWYDPHAALIRQYYLNFFPADNTCEMYDPKNRRPFLRRVKTEVGLEDLYIGRTLNIMSRQLNCVDYGDEFTRRKLCSKMESTLGIIKPDAVSKMGQIMEMVHEAGLRVGRLKMCSLSRDEAMDFYSEHQHKGFFNSLVDFMTSGPVMAFEMRGAGGISRWRQLLGPTDSATARSENPSCIRARFGTDNTRNACHGSDSPGSAAREVEFFFPSRGARRKSTATFSDCTCCVIKPHAVAEGQAGSIISRIMQEGFEISAMSTFNLEKANAEDFLEVYKGVVSEYSGMVEELTSGPCIALEVRAQDAPNVFRKFVGPADPEIARHLRPNTLRALYGKNKLQNGVHCTDMPEDALLEVEYFFKILDS